MINRIGNSNSAINLMFSKYSGVSSALSSLPRASQSSGIDYASINSAKLEKIMENRANKQNSQLNSLNSYSDKALSFYGEFYPEMTDLKNAANQLKSAGSASVFSSTTYGSDNAAVVSDVSGTASGSQPITVQVNNLAQGMQTNYTPSPQDKSSALVGKSSMTFNVDGKSTSVNFDISATKNNKQAMEQIASDINSAKVGIKAQVTTKDGNSSLSFVSDKTGKDASFSVSMSASLKTALGAGTSTVGKDANYSVNGKSFTSASNDVKLEGSSVSATLSGTGSATLSSRKTNTEDVVLAVKNFADSYNSVLSFLKDNSKLSRGVSDLAQSFSSTKYMAGSLSSIGVTADSSGKLSVNESALKNSLATQPDKVKSVLGSTGLAGNTATKVTNAVNNSSSLVKEPSFASKFQGSYVPQSYNSPFNTYQNSSSVGFLFDKFA